MNPEAVVVRHNLVHPAEVEVDYQYLSELSDDAVPTIAALLPELDSDARTPAQAHLGCAPLDDFTGWAAWNLGEHRADAVRDRLCPT
jgi:hypothetical protein